MVSDEVDSWDYEGEVDEVVLEVMCLFYKVDFFEFVEVYVGVDEFVFWGGVIFFEFRVLVFGGYGW